MLFCGMIIRNEEDRSQIENLYHSYHRMMFYIALGILKNREKAEDAVSQAFLKMIDHLQKFSFEDCNKTKGLIGIIVKGICYDMLRSESRRSLISLEEINVPDSFEDLPYENLAAEESYQIILDGISGLGEKSSGVLTLKYVYGYSDCEIAELLNISPENVRVRLHRAKKVLCQILKERGTVNE